MFKSTRDKISFFRKRHNVRKIINDKRKLVILFSSIIIIFFFIFIIFVCKNIVGNKDSTKIVESQNNDVNIYNNDNSNNIVNNDNNLNTQTNKDTNETNKIKFTVLGEIMMGGQVTTNLDYSYISAFKNIYSITSESDFTYSTLDTDIIDLSQIDSDATSKYLVTKQIISGLGALGIDSVSVATEHIVDFTDDIFKNTVNLLNQNKIYAAGLIDTPVYLQKGNKKIAIISANDVIIGTSTNYTRNSINIYDKEKMKQDILTAKQNADFVIVAINWGKEYTYGVTDRMKQIAQNSIDDGADLIVGTNSLGIYPLTEYNEKPIIYSTGYLMSDLDYNLAKQGCIFNIDINNKNKIEEIDMIPIYIENKKKVQLYSNYNYDEANEYIKQINNWNQQNGLNSNIANDIIKIIF